MQTKPVDILLFVEHVARELDLACLFKQLLEGEHGTTVVLASTMYDLDVTLRQWDPHLVVLPFSFPGEDQKVLGDIIRAFPRARYIDLAYEQLYHGLNRSFRVPQGAFPPRHVLHLAWGEFFSSFLEQGGIPGEHICVNGNPVYWLYREPYKRFFTSRAEIAEKHGLDPEKRWILIPENYKAAFLPATWFDTYVQWGAQKADTDDYREFDSRSLQIVMKWWIEAASRTDAEIIVRPRPTTHTNDVIHAFQTSTESVPSNLRVIKDGSVREWILAADAVVSSISTCLIEAAVAGKPVYILMPHPFPSYLKMDWFDHVPAIESGEMFVSLASGGNDVPVSDDLRVWAETEMMSQGDAIRSVVMKLVSALHGDLELPPSPSMEFVRAMDDRSRSDSTDDTLSVRKKLWVARHNMWRWIKQFIGPGAKETSSEDRSAKPLVAEKTLREQYGGDNFSAQDITDRSDRWRELLMQVGAGQGEVSRRV